MSDLSDKKKSGYRRLLIPALVLLAAAGLLYVLRFNPHSLEAIRGPWNERWWLILGLQIGWITCASLGGVLLILWLGNVTSPALAVTLLVILPIFAVILFPIFERAREGGGPHCMGYQRQLAYAVLMYTQDHVMIFPGNANEAFASIKPMFRACPMTQRHPYRPWGGYGLNAHIAGQSIETVMKHGPQRILVTADSVQPGMLLTSPRDIDHRHDGGYIASFADGHIEYMKGDIPLEIK